MTTPASLAIRTARLLTPLTALAAFVAGLPWTLATVVGDPLTGMPRLTDTHVTGLQIQHVLALAGWALWTCFIAAVIIEAVCALRGTRAPRIRMLTPLQGLAAFLIAGLLAAPAATAATVHTRPAVITTVTTAPAFTQTPALHIDSGGPARGVPTVTSETLVRDSADQQVLVQAGDRHYTYTVHHGDTLWAIAGEWLGNHDRWEEIYQLNEAHYDQHGRMHHGNLILPGWTLRLPADATPPPGATPTTAPPSGHTASPPTATPAPTPAPTTLARTAPSEPGPAISAQATPAPSPSRHTVTSAQSPTATPRIHTAAGIHLRGQDWLDLGLASALIAAAAMVWGHRRRRYKPQPPSPAPRWDDPDLAPLPEDLTIVRHALRAEPGIALGEDGTGFVDIAPIDPEDDEDDEYDENDGPSELAGDDDTLETPRLVIPALTYPAAATWPPAGLGLTGPGADAAACGFLVGALTDRRADQPEERPQVVIPSGTLATLLGTDAVLLGATPRLTVTGSLDDALDVLDRAVLTRTRLVRDSDTEDVAAMRGVGFFDEPVPPLLLIAEAAEHGDRTRVAAVLTQGERLDVHGVLLGRWPAGNTVAVARNGLTSATATSDDGGGNPADVDRLTVLEPARAADLIRVAIEADTGEAQPSSAAVHAAALAPPPTPSVAALTASEDAPDTGARNPDDEEPSAAEAAGDAHAPVHPATVSAAPSERDSDQDGAIDDIPAKDVAPPGHATTPADMPESVDVIDESGVPDDTNGTGPDQEEEDGDIAESQDEEEGHAPSGPVRVHLFGTDVVVEDLPKDRPVFRSGARDILAFLILHPTRIPDDVLAEKILWYVKNRVVKKRLNTLVWSLRGNLVAAAGKQTYVVRHSRPDWTELVPSALDVDVWRMREHLADAARATDPAARIAALQAAVAEYTGPLMGRIEDEWIEPFRQEYLRQVLDARSELAALLAPTDIDAALAVLAEALRLSPYTEALYLQAMRLHAARGDIDGIRVLRGEATQQLADIDAEPSEELIDTADRLIGEIRHRPRGGSG